MTHSRASRATYVAKKLQNSGWRVRSAEGRLSAFSRRAAATYLPADEPDAETMPETAPHPRVAAG